MSHEYWYGELETLGERNLVESLRACMPSDETWTIDNASRLLTTEYQRIALKESKQKRLSCSERQRHAHTAQVLDV